MSGSFGCIHHAEQPPMPSNLDHARTVLAANNVAAEGSFMYAIHEEQVFDTGAFWRLFEAMKTIADAPPERRGDDARQMAARVHQQVFLHMIYHLHPKVGMHIVGFPMDDLHAWLDRLAWVFDPVVLGTKGYGEPLFDDELSAATGPQH